MEWAFLVFLLFLLTAFTLLSYQFISVMGTQPFISLESFKLFFGFYSFFMFFFLYLVLVAELIKRDWGKSLKPERVVSAKKHRCCEYKLVSVSSLSVIFGDFHNEMNPGHHMNMVKSNKASQPYP